MQNSVVRVARRVDEKIAEDAIHQPGRRLPAGLDLAEGDLELVQRIVARLVDARMLAGRADEQAGEEIRQRRMVEPVAEQAFKQVGPPQEWRLRRRGTAQRDMVAARSEERRVGK